MRVFLTSRPDVDIRILRKHALVVKVSASDADLTQYARKHLQDNSNIQRMLEESSDGVMNKIIDLIVSRASGMCVDSVSLIFNHC